MSLLALIMGAVMSGSTVIEYGKQPLDTNLVAQVSTYSIQHVWYSSDDYRQAIVQRAYDLWWMDFVIMIECENGNWNPYAISKTNDHGVCQLNYRYNKKFIDSDEFKDVNKQLEYCYNKRKINPKLWYWPDRKIKWVKCSEYVLDRFIIQSWK